MRLLVARARGMVCASVISVLLSGCALVEQIGALGRDEQHVRVAAAQDEAGDSRPQIPRGARQGGDRADVRCAAVRDHRATGDGLGLGTGRLPDATVLLPGHRGAKIARADI